MSDAFMDELRRCKCEQCRRAADVLAEQDRRIAELEAEVARLREDAERRESLWLRYFAEVRDRLAPAFALHHIRNGTKGDEQGERIGREFCRALGYEDYVGLQRAIDAARARERA